MGGLLAGATLAVDADPDDLLGKPRGECGIAGDVEALLACLRRAPHDHVLYQHGIEVVALNERF